MIIKRNCPTLILILTAILFSSSAHAGPTLGPVDDMTSAQSTQLWKLHWKSYADAYAKVGDQYFMNPNWDRRYPSSIKMTPTQWQRENTTKKRVPAPGGLTKLDFSAPVREEVVAAVYALPELEVGHWGRLHSVYVDNKLDKKTIVGTAIYLVDREEIESEIKKAEERGRELLIKQAELERIEREKERKRYQSGNRDRTRRRNDDRDRSPKITSQQIKAEIDERYQHRRELIKKQDRLGTDKLILKGFDASSVGKGKRWNGNGPQGIEVVVVGRYALPQEKSSTSSRFASTRSNNLLVAVPRKAFEETMKEEEFAALLKTRGFTPEQFVVMVRDSLRDQKPDEARTDVLRMIEKTSSQQLKLGQPDDGEKIASGDQPDNNTAEDKPRELSLEEKLAQMLNKDKTAEGDKPREGNAPKDGDKPREGDAPKDGDKPREGDAPKDGDKPAEGQKQKKSLEQKLKELRAKSKNKSD